ncbi:spore germination protein [Metallumcola ferriviriculae]|uniref:Spore germination protein n=1 Tax=Metallumcola ferriviriculae TaxID=3039180 RepID=A0AAU0UPK5_9FIRM|nr:spore germination protein [Desulfitibacteraceae bacterium MK1]
MTENINEKMPVSKKLSDNKEWIYNELSPDNSFDLMWREITVAGKDAALLFVDGFAKDDIMLWIMRRLTSIERDQITPNTFEKIVKKQINYLETDGVDDLHKVVDTILSGPIALFVDGLDQAIVIDARTYPARGPQEPDLERVVRGSRDGFVETIVFNTALIRRRIRDPKLRMEIMNVGRRSKQDICISYIDDIANPRLVEKVKSKLTEIDIDGLPMAEKSVEELITPGSFWNPFPRVRYTERPDVAAQHLLEGHVLIIVDTSPSVIILPATFFHHVQHAEEFREAPPVGAYLRWVRFIGMIGSVFIAPLWLLFSLEPSLLPESLKFIGPTDVGKVGLMWQFLFAQLGIDLMRMAAVHTPSALATALGLIAAVLIGQVAIDIGLFAPEVILYMAVAAIGSFATPSYEMSMANRLVRVALLVGTGLLRLPGFAGVTVLYFMILALTKSFGVPYLWPLIPFNYKAFKSIIIRSPVPIQNLRPSILKPIDPDRQPAVAMKPKDDPDEKE